MSTSALHRYADADDLAARAAERLLHRLVELQADGRVAQVCLTGGWIALRLYHQLGHLLEGSGLDPARLELWWGDERFVPTDDPQRHASHTLAAFAGSFPLDAARTHPMPAADGVIDASAAAATYAKELGSTQFDICLLGVGMDGHVASIFPGHPSFEATDADVIGVADAPLGPERISLTVPALCRSREVWFLASGAEKAGVLAAGMDGRDDLPVGVVRGRERTEWLADRAALAELPSYACEL